MNSLRSKMDASKALLLVVDIQERMCAAMDAHKLPRFMNRNIALIEGAKALSLPILVTEQYPKGLGNTVEQIKTILPQNSLMIEKIDFSCISPSIIEAMVGREQIILCGMETHVCIFQTARDLLQMGKTPFLCADAILSRQEEDRYFGLERARELGAVVSTVEGVLFDLLKKAGSVEFKQISAAVK